MGNPMYSNYDEYGFERPDNFDNKLHEEIMGKYMRILVRRSLRWKTLKGRYNKSNKLKRFIRKGIPLDLRTQVWMNISGGQLLKDKYNNYNELKISIKNKALIEMIMLDIPRTFPDNINFINDEYLKKPMYNVLSTFAHQNSEVGYCQGLNYICGLLLLATRNEETTYWLLKILIENILPKYSVTNMSGLLIDLDVLDELVKNFDIDIHKHVKKIGLSWAMVTTKWFICLFVDVLPTETILRVWDCIFNEGSKIIFKVGLTILKLIKDELLNTKDLSQLINVFKNVKYRKEFLDCHQFMGNVFKISGKLTDEDLRILRTKYSN